MKLYLITAHVDVSEDSTKFDDRAIWAGSQTDAATARKELIARGAKRKDLKTSEVEVPTNKEGLISFLNTLSIAGAGVAAAAEKLTAK